MALSRPIDCDRTHLQHPSSPRHPQHGSAHRHALGRQGTDCPIPCRDVLQVPVRLRLIALWVHSVDLRHMNRNLARLRLSNGASIWVALDIPGSYLAAVLDIEACAGACNLEEPNGPLRVYGREGEVACLCRGCCESACVSAGEDADGGHKAGEYRKYWLTIC